MSELPSIPMLAVIMTSAAGCDPVKGDQPRDRHPVLHAIRRGRIRSLAVLLAVLGEIALMPRYLGFTPIFQALHNRQWDMMRYIISVNPSCVYQVVDNDTLLHHMVAALWDITCESEATFFATVSAVLAVDPSTVAAQNKKKNTPLHSCFIFRYNAYTQRLVSTLIDACPIAMFQKNDERESPKDLAMLRLGPKDSITRLIRGRSQMFLWDSSTKTVSVLPINIRKRPREYTLTGQETRIIESIATPAWLKANLNHIERCSSEVNDTTWDEVIVATMQFVLRRKIPIDDISKALAVADYILDIPKRSALNILHCNLARAEADIDPGRWTRWLGATKPKFRSWNGKVNQNDFPKLVLREYVTRAICNIVINDQVCVIRGESGIGKTAVACMIPQYLQHHHSLWRVGRDQDWEEVEWVGILIPPPTFDFEGLKAEEQCAKAEKLVCDEVATLLDAILAQTFEKHFGEKVAAVLFLDDAFQFGTLLQYVVDRHRSIRCSLTQSYQLAEVFIIVAGASAPLRYSYGGYPNFKQYNMPPKNRIAVDHSLRPIFEQRPMLALLAENYRCYAILEWYLTSVARNPLNIDEFTVVQAVAKGFAEMNGGLSKLQTVDERQKVFGVAWRVLFGLDITALQAHQLCIDCGMAVDGSYLDHHGRAWDAHAVRYSISPAMQLLLLIQFAESRSASPSTLDGVYAGVIVGAIQALRQGAPGECTIRRVLHLLKLRNLSAPPIPANRECPGMNGRIPGSCPEALALADKVLPPCACYSRKLLQPFEPEIGINGVTFRVDFHDRVPKGQPSILVAVNKKESGFADVMLWVTWDAATNLHVNIQLQRGEEQGLSRAAWNAALWAMGSREPGLPRDVWDNSSPATMCLLLRHRALCGKFPSLRRELLSEIQASFNNPAVRRAILNCIQHCSATEWAEFAGNRAPPRTADEVTMTDVDYVFWKGVSGERFWMVMVHINLRSEWLDDLYLPLAAPSIQVLHQDNLPTRFPGDESFWADGLTTSAWRLPDSVYKMWLQLRPAPSEPVHLAVAKETRAPSDDVWIE